MKKLLIITLIPVIFLVLVSCGINDNVTDIEQDEIDLLTFPQALLQDFSDSCLTGADLNRDKCETNAALMMEEILRPIYQDELFLPFDTGTLILGEDDVWISVWPIVNIETMDLDYEVERIRIAVIAMKSLPTDLPIEFLIIFDPTDIAYQTHFFSINTHDLIGYDLATYDFARHFAEDEYSYPESIEVID